jgi:hypothetical protein
MKTSYAIPSKNTEILLLSLIVTLLALNMAAATGWIG